MNKNDLSRRRFITSGALTLSGLTLGFPLISKALGNSNTIRTGLIGTGSRGTGLATLLKEIPALQLVACCDPIPGHLANGMKLAAPNAKAYTDYRTLLADKSIDAVIIATPLFTHYQIAVDALSAGKHIYLEKSMSYDIPQSIDLVNKVNNSKLVFQVGYQYRYYGLYQRIKEVIKDNWIGKITGFECQYNQNSNWRKPNNDPALERAINWRMYREYCGGPLSELCAHQIDMVNYILDSHPQNAIGIAGINYWKDGRDTYDNIRTVYEYPGGILSTVTSVLSNGYRDYNIRILGDTATIDISRDKALIYPESRNNRKGTVDGVTGATIKVTGEGEELKFGTPETAGVEPTIFSLRDFVTCILQKKTPVSNVHTAHTGSVSIHMGNMAADKRELQLWKPEYNV
jgi:predicted dehydrogenase